MTRSARRSNKANAAPHQLSTSDKQCQECHGPLVHTHGISYICTKCGLVQDIEQDE